MNILIKNAMIVTMEDQESVIKNGYVIIEDGVIKEVNSGKYIGSILGHKIIDGAGCAVLPGFINCHTHVAMTLLRGYGEGLPLMKWLNEKIWPFEAKLNEEDIYIGSTAGMIEMIKGGTTTFSDMYFMQHVVGKATIDIGMRGCLGNPIIGEAWEKQLEETVKIYEMFKDNPLIIPMVAPHSPYTCSETTLESVGELARKYSMPVHIHISETEDETNIIKNKYNMTSTMLCERKGLFNGNKVLAAHCVHVTDEDVDILVKNDITAVHNPQSNMKLASGAAPIVKMIKNGVNVAIGTDGASSNNNLNMIEEMQTASLLQKLVTKDATALGAYETLRLATVNAAKAIGMDGILGMIKKGYAADIIMMDISRPHMVPIHDIYSNIVFSAQGSDVKTVIINGRIVMEDRRIKGIDEVEIIKKVSSVVENILKR